MIYVWILSDDIWTWCVWILSDDIWTWYVWILSDDIGTWSVWISYNLRKNSWVWTFINSMYVNKLVGLYIYQQYVCQQTRGSVHLSTVCMSSNSRVCTFINSMYVIIIRIGGHSLNIISQMHSHINHFDQCVHKITITIFSHLSNNYPHKPIKPMDKYQLKRQAGWRYNYHNTQLYG